MEQYDKIFTKAIINDNAYRDISELEKSVVEHDKIALKLELEYKRKLSGSSHISQEEKNEFLCYNNGKLIGYIGIVAFGEKNSAEVTGMIHPDYRGEGRFKKLFSLAIEECRRRGFREILLLTDGNSQKGKEFIISSEGKYSFSEYRMFRGVGEKEYSVEEIILRKAENSHADEIRCQDETYFGMELDNGILPEEQEKLGETTYLALKDEEIIGKVRICSEGESAYICGLGIKPEHRERGYGTALLKAALNIIKSKGIMEAVLDVECRNKKALNIYIRCGFTEESVMEYYKIK